MRIALAVMLSMLLVVGPAGAARAQTAGASDNDKPAQDDAKPALTEGQEKQAQREARLRMWVEYDAAQSRLRQTRPKRRNGPTREENLSDIEVRNIMAVARRFNPDAIINISEVTTGCRCEDGDSCTAQVWLVAQSSDRSRGLMLSQIDGQWDVGPVQDWWFKYDSLMLEMQRQVDESPADAFAIRNEYNDQIVRLTLAFPKCEAASR